ncbi:MAG: hypothetical protein HFI18_12035 [Lachnospiraceae bacterium]|nr:hypothetical protein [Lachnospiraceae bacterium]
MAMAQDASRERGIFGQMRNFKKQHQDENARKDSVSWLWHRMLPEKEAFLGGCGTLKNSIRTKMPGRILCHGYGTGCFQRKRHFWADAEL